MTPIPTVQLNNGRLMPALGLGTLLVAISSLMKYLSFSKSIDSFLRTLKFNGNEAVATLKAAIDVGYRHFDTAYLYCSEKEIGQAIREKIAEGVIQREDVFVTTKLWNTFHEPNHVEEAFHRSLTNLDIDYVDLYLMHSPMSYAFVDWEPEESITMLTDIDYLDTWYAMEKLLDTGKVNSIGVSNFNSEQVERMVKMCNVKPVTNQIECNPGNNQRKLIEFCRNLDITVTAFSPLGRPNYYKKDPSNIPRPALDDSRVLEIGKQYNKTPAQVILRYLVDIGTVPIPKADNIDQLLENINIFDFKLQENHLKIIDKLNTGRRTLPLTHCIQHKYYPFNID